jgi:hypothetical protein
VNGFLDGLSVDANVESIRVEDVPAVVAEELQTSGGQASDTDFECSEGVVYKEVD